MRRSIIGLIIGALALAACAADLAAEPVVDITEAASGTEELSMENVSDDSGGSDGLAEVDLQLSADRQVIRHASLQLHATDTRAAFDQIVAMVQGMGGFVADATVHPTTSEDAQPQVSMTLRVPVDVLDETLDSIKGTADEVVSETQGAEDVSEQFVDLEARLTNLEALEIELRALLQETRERQSAKPDEILQVFNELSSVRGQIEQLQGQMDHLSDLAALATVQLAITQTPSAAPLVDEPWDPGVTVREAAGDLVSGLQGVVDWLLTFAISTLPLLIVVVGPLVAISLVAYRRIVSRRKDGEPAPAGS